MKRIELISSKEYWVETLEAMQQLGHSDYEIATVISDKVVEAINYSQCCKTLPSKDEAKIEMKQFVSDYYGDSETKEVLEFAIGFTHCFNWIAK